MFFLRPEQQTKLAFFSSSLHSIAEWEEKLFAVEIWLSYKSLLFKERIYKKKTRSPVSSNWSRREKSKTKNFSKTKLEQPNMESNIGFVQEIFLFSPLFSIQFCFLYLTEII